jgi:hydroxymethylpyrimidine/phosphomethylpyrimidine kinase
MGHIVPDRFFWALPPPEEGQGGEAGTDAEPDEPAGGAGGGKEGKGAPRRVH